MSKTLVTGGAKNLGKEIVLKLAKNKQDLLIHYNKSKKEAFELVKECHTLGVKAEAVFGDFSNFEGMKAFIDLLKPFKKIKNIVNNVGNYLVKPVLETSFNETNALFMTNLFAPLFLIQSIIPSIKEEKGSIVNIGVCGIDHGRAENYSMVYSMTKASLLMLTRSLAKDLALFDVTVNMVSPGMLEDSFDAPINAKELPMKRFGTKQEVADVVLFLLNPNNHYITGQNIEVAGGLRL